MTREEIHLEILKLAQQLVINDYTDKRANLHNEWVAQSEELWRTRKLKLAYPPIPPYPTSSEVYNCAIPLLNFVERKDDLTPHTEIVEEVADDSTPADPAVDIELIPTTAEELPHITSDDSPSSPSLLNRIKKALK